jgi:hypothetical protein
LDNPDRVYNQGLQAVKHFRAFRRRHAIPRHATQASSQETLSHFSAHFQAFPLDSISEIGKISERKNDEAR